MNLPDLRIFISAARRPTLAEVAQEMHLTPSAVSKALRRLEDSIGQPLFDRSARQLVLNPRGALLLPRAQTLLALADQARADVQGETAAIDCRIAGPAILLWRHGAALAAALNPYPAASLHMQAMFEDDALAALARGEAHAAIVTGEVLDGKGRHWSQHWAVSPLGTLAQHLVAGRAHPLVQALQAAIPQPSARQAPAARRAATSGAPGSVDAAAMPGPARDAAADAGMEAAGTAGRINAPGTVLRARAAQVLEHDFACPSHSLFCGEGRGARSDGWRDDRLPRKIRYWSDDLQLLLSFVKSGQALAYLPDFALDAAGLVRIEVMDAAFACREQVALVYDGERAPDWLRQLAVQCGNGTHA